MIPKETVVSQPIETPTLHAHAMNDLRFIRSTMERASSFTAVPGYGMVVMGATAALTAYLSSQRADAEGWLVIWLAEAVLATSIAFISMGYKARSAKISLFTGAGWRFILNLFVPVFAGVPLTLVFYQQGLTEILPGLWLLLYGTGVVTGGAFSVRIIPTMGFGFILTGVVTLFVSPYWGDYMLAFGFGGLHIIFGGAIARRHGG